MGETRRKSGSAQRELEQLRAEVEALRLQLEESNQTLEAIRSGAVDALVIDTPEGQRVFSLQGAERPYRELIEQMQEGAATLTRDGTIHYCNRAFAGLLKRPMEAVVGTRIETHVCEADRPAFAALLREGRTCSAHGEVGLATPDGRTVPVYVGLTLVVDGGEASVSLVVTDRTERKQHEASMLRLNEELEQRVTQRTAELQAANLQLAGEAAERKRQAAAAEQQRQLLAVTLASIGDAVIVTDAQGRVTFLNAEAERLTGWAGAQAQGQPLPAVFRIVNEETRQPVENPVDKVLRLGTVVGLANHTILIARDGTETPIDDSAALIRQRDGATQGVVLVFRDFSEQKAAGKALRESEARFRTMADAMPQLAWTAQPDGYIHWYNRRWYEYTGTTPQRMEGWGWQSVHDPAVLPQVLERWKISLAAGQPFDMEFPLRGADGKFRTFLTRAIPLKDGEGRVVQWFGTNTDVEDSKRVEEALRVSEERFRALAENVPDLITRFDRNLRLLYANPAVYRRTGLSAEALAGRTPREYGAAPSAVEQWERVAREVLDRGEPRRLEAASEWQGQTRVYDTQLIPERDAGGRVQAVVACARDITERKEAEEALRQNNARMQKVLEVETVGVMFWDLSTGCLVDANDTFLKMMGYSRSDVDAHNLTWQKFTPPEYHEVSRAEVAKFMATGRVGPYEKEYFRKDGTRQWLLFAGSSLGHNQCVEFCVDISDRKRAEEELKAAKLSAEQAKAAAETASKAKDHFLAVLSHELRTPLAPVVATLAMLQDDPRFDADTRDSLELIRRNVELEARLIDDLLDVTRIERGKIELDRQPVELCTVIRRAAEVCLPDIQARKLEFAIDIPDGPYLVDADVARLQQVFWNLLKNAIKFTPSGGFIGVRCRRVDDHVLAEVNDSGEGIDLDVLPRLFNAFEQGDRRITRQFGGLGLGLAISKAIAEMHGGALSAHSEGKGKGATFTVRLPLCDVRSANQEKQAAAASAESQAGRHKLRILLVEDHGDTARIMRMLLMADGHEVQIAADVATALALATGQPFDLMLSDLGLPDGSGLDLMRALRQKGLKLPAIALSGYGQEQDVEQSLQAGFATHLVKPVSLPKLEEAIAKAVAVSR